LRSKTVKIITNRNIRLYQLNSLFFRKTAQWSVNGKKRVEPYSHKTRVKGLMKKGSSHMHTNEKVVPK
jgi:hypothetical protein